MAPALRDPNAVKILGVVPGAERHRPGRSSSPRRPAIQNTRQEVVRVDYDLSPNYRLTGRYSHDNSFTEEPGGLFLGLAVPNVATTDTNVPGQVAAAILRSTHGGSKLNELQFQFSSNTIADTNQSADRNLRSSLGLNIPELFPSNDLGVMPLVTVTGQLSTDRRQPAVQHRLQELHGHRQLHLAAGHRTAFKFGGLMTFEQKNENASNVTQGNFTFGAGGGRTAFYNFLSGNADGLCGNACTYSEAQNDVTEHLRFNRYEMFAQDSWKPRANVTVDYGVRYSLYPPITDANNVLTNFLAVGLRRRQRAQVRQRGVHADHRRHRRSAQRHHRRRQELAVRGRDLRVRQGRHPAAHRRHLGSEVDRPDDLPRFVRDVLRPGAGRHLRAELVHQPAVRQHGEHPEPEALEPRRGTSATTTGVLALIGNGDDFKTPRTQEWNAGVQQQLYARGAIDVSYVGSHGDHLIRPIDINYPNPADVLRLGRVNLARPYQGYGAITLRETTARSNYWGILSSFRHNGGAAGSLTLNYTLSRNRTDATNDRDAVDIPQDPHNLAVEYADARTDRRHIFTANYVYEIPFLKDSSNTLLKAVLAGWQIAGITVDQLGPAGVAHLGKHQRLPPRRPSQHRRRSRRGRPDGESLLVQPERVRAGGRRHLRQLGPFRVAPAGTQSDRPLAVEELDVQRHAALPVPRRRDQRVQPHAVAGGSQRRRARQHLHDQPDDVQPVERHVRPDPEHARAARDSARVQVLLVRRPEGTAETAERAEIFSLRSLRSLRFLLYANVE